MEYHLMKFEELGLQAELLRAVSSEGYTTPTPVQVRTIPAVLKGRDVLARAQTGTGKTAAFTLPMLQLLNKDGRGRYPRALVLTPTRELAAQVAESVRTYGRHMHLRSAVVFGGVGIHPQIEKLRRGVDILVATPGRLLDHLSRRTVNLSKVEILVLDEADRMLDMGFIHDIKKILGFLPVKKQNLLFSATFSDEIKRLADAFIRTPEIVEVARSNAAAETVTQVVHPVGHTRKRELLSHLIKEGEWNRVLVFTRTKHGANRLANQLLKDGVSATAIHGNKSQAARTKALSDFKRGAVRTLVATDIAARGLDIDHLPHVVNFELPNVPEDYVHRIGRTGRAGEEGTALSLVCRGEQPLLRNIQRTLRYDIQVEQIENFGHDQCPEDGHLTQRAGGQRAGDQRRARPGGQGYNRPGDQGYKKDRFTSRGAAKGRGSNGRSGGRRAG
jgi:ATP-dependent RNA helicase RhlE